MPNIREEIKGLTAQVRTALDEAFEVARKDIQNGQLAKSETMHNILDATFSAIENLSEAVDKLAQHVSEGKK